MKNDHISTLYIHKTNHLIMSKTDGSQTKCFCGECNASFLTQEGLETHFQRQHGNYCDTCPIDMAIQKITNMLRHGKH